MKGAPGEPARVEVEQRGEGVLAVRVGGDWRLDSSVPEPETLLAGEGGEVRRLELDGAGVASWDSRLPTWLRRLRLSAESRSIETDQSALPEGLRRLLDLSFAVPANEDAARGSERRSPLERIGLGVLRAWKGALETLEFIGDATLSFGRLLRGKARFRGSDLLLAIQECGAEAFWIVSLVSFLTGLILAFVGAIQLQTFGAEIYVANLVAVGMAREMSALMTGIVLAGRTGAAYAAQLGTMTVNEEVDAFRAFGFLPMDFLVLPRMLALVLMTPLLALYASLMGILGGFVVAVGVLGIEPAFYMTQTQGSVGVDDFAVGLVKASVIGVLVAVAGCMRGMQSGRSASAVGLATTSAVVTAIVLIVISEALFSVLFQVLGI
jgi:phospholipid/cholesterol/gamma-HCH transport system permease protein